MSESTDSESESEEESGGGEMSESTVERSDAEKSTPGEKKKKKKKKGGKGKIRRRKKIEKERKKMKKEKAKQSIDTMVVIPLETSGLYPASWLLQKKPMLSDLMMTYYWGPSWSVPDHQWFIHAGFPEDSSRENNPSFQRTFNTKDFSNQVLEDMKIFWPERAQKFWLDRWQKHCRGTGMTPEEYFSTVLDIHRAIQSITGDDGIDLESGVSMKANEAVSILEKKLGRVRISTVKCKEDDYIAELKILIEKKSYSIGWRLKMSSYLGSIEDKGGESMVILPNEPLEPREKKKKDLKEKTGNKVL